MSYDICNYDHVNPLRVATRCRSAWVLPGSKVQVIKYCVDLLVFDIIINGMAILVSYIQVPVPGTGYIAIPVYTPWVPVPIPVPGTLP